MRESDSHPPATPQDPTYPLIAGKDYAAESVFRPENLLREARRQRGIADISVPPVCLLDPDGDIVRYLARTGRGQRHPGWACYHTEMWTTYLPGASTAGPGIEIGVVGMAVGAPFAVLVAEQLTASGVRLTLSITSAGQITRMDEPPYFVLIERAWRDEGTSAHYLPPGRWSILPGHLLRRLDRAFDSLDEHVRIGSAWTTDAPYRETSAAIRAAEREGIACVEMEAAALYAYATAQQRDVVCIAHITNTIATAGDDFDKGADNGVHAALAVAHAATTALLPAEAFRAGTQVTTSPATRC
ncbi:nucleoside phosphorylase [Nocardia sp. NPDC051990]|uniref:nucleoside phosphorylase n=1 Tax=Nocardia sp. NPDC051990 TaxID=3155285 RepID=UPI003446D641